MRKNSSTLALCPLVSGSKGNAYWIEAGETTLLIDCGISYRQLKLRADTIGRHLDQIDHVFISHEHTDHIQGLHQFLRKHNPVIWASRGTLHYLRPLIPAGAKVRMLDSRLETAGEVEVRGVPVNHDASQPIGFHLKFNNLALAVITDLGRWDSITMEAVRNVDLLVCEANHDLEMLYNGPYPFYLKRRIASPFGHLSNEDGAKLAIEAVRGGAKEIILGHLSETNNVPNLALDVFARTMESANLAVHLSIASQRQPGPWVEI